MNVLSQMERQSDVREQQIMRIAKSVQELAQVMHEMSVLVTEQGSILDRIDYNVSNALVDIKAGEKNVEDVRFGSLFRFCAPSFQLCTAFDWCRARTTKKRIAHVWSLVPSS